MDWVQTTARRDKKHLKVFGFGASYIGGLTVDPWQNTHLTRQHNSSKQVLLLLRQELSKHNQPSMQSSRKTSLATSPVGLVIDQAH